MVKPGKTTLFVVLFCLSLLLWTAAADNNTNNTCSPKQITLSLGDHYYNGARDIATTGALEIAKIVWVTLGECYDGYVTITEVNPTNETLIFKPRLEIFSLYINYTKKGTHSEGQYDRTSHTADLFNIKTGVLLQAIVTSGNETSSFRFKIPDSKRKDKPLTFLMYADIDNGNISKPTFSTISTLLANDTNEVDFTMFNGDVAYEIINDGGLKGDQFFEDYQPLVTTRPTVMTPGNHEFFYNYSLLNYRWKMPLYNETNNHWYSWDIGYAHFIAYDLDYYDTADNATKQRMADWIEKDLQAANSTANRTERPWIIVYTHRPIYCSTNIPNDTEKGKCYSFYAEKIAWDELLYKYRVDLVLAGHVHSYERMGPIYQNHSMFYETFNNSDGVQVVKNPAAPVHIIDGSGGNDYYMPKEYFPPNNYSFKTDFNVGYSLVTIHDGSMISFKHFKSDGGTIIDQFVLQRDRKSSGWVLWLVLGLLLIGLAIAAGVFIYRRRMGKDKQVSDVEEPMFTGGQETSGKITRGGEIN